MRPLLRNLFAVFILFGILLAPVIAQTVNEAPAQVSIDKKKLLVQPRNADGEVYFELKMTDAWVWDMYRPARFVKQVKVITFKDVNVEELDKPDLRLPEDGPFRG